MKYACILLSFLLILSFNSGSAQVCFEKTFGNLDDDYGNAIHTTFQGGYIICGYTTNLITSEQDLYVIMVDQNGDSLWTKSMAFSSLDMRPYVEETFDSGFVIAGKMFNVSSLIKFDRNGDTLWSKRYPTEAEFESLFGVIQTPDSGFILSGTQQGTSFWDISAVLIKTDRYGEFKWRKTFGHSGYCTGRRVEIASDNGFVICGGYDPPGENSDAWIVKTNDQGIHNWDREIGGNNTLESLFDVKRTPDSGYILCGGYYPGLLILSGDMYLVKTNINGIVQWTKQIGWENNDSGNSVDVTPDGGFIACGSTNGFPETDENLFLVRTNANGDTLWTRSFGGPYQDAGTSVLCTSDGGFIVTGITRSFGCGGSEVYLIKTNENGVITSDFLKKDFPVMIFPNPNDGLFRIKSGQHISRVELMDSRGIMILKKQNIAGNEEIIDIRNFSEGIYILKLYTESGFIIKKILVEKTRDHR